MLTAPAFARGGALADPVEVDDAFETTRTFAICLTYAHSRFLLVARPKGLPMGATFIAPTFHDNALSEVQKRFEATTKKRQATCSPLIAFGNRLRKHFHVPPAAYLGIHQLPRVWRGC